MPTSKPSGSQEAFNRFYDVSHNTRRSIHEQYIDKTLGELGSKSNVVHMTSQEFTGPRDFAEFWLDELISWENSHDDIYITLSGVYDVMHPILNDNAYLTKHL